MGETDLGSHIGAFARLLNERQPDPSGRRWVFVAYDQLSDRIGPLSREDPAELGIILIENPWKACLRPYHKQKLALVLSNLRHFAIEQAERGVAVRHSVAHGLYRDALKGLIRELDHDGPIRMMAPAERELRVDLQPLVDAGAINATPHEGWLTTHDQFERSQKTRSWRMDAFYRLTRLRLRPTRRVGRRQSDERSWSVGSEDVPELTAAVATGH